MDKEADSKLSSKLPAGTAGPVRLKEQGNGYISALMAI